MSEPYYQDEHVTLYHGDCREVIPARELKADLIVADPPYGETSLKWDTWPNDWPNIALLAASSMWVFGSFRMFFERGHQFAVWKLSQDIIWEKHEGSGFATDRFRRVHEFALHWYRGDWRSIYRHVPRIGVAGPDKSVRRIPVAKGHHGDRGPSSYVDNGTRLARSVIKTRNLHARNLHPTEKTQGILTPLIEYGCRPGGTVLDPFAGSGSTAVAAVMAGRKAVLVEADERYCEVIANRLQQGVLEVTP